MKLKLQSKRLSYTLTLAGKFTMLQGLSGTGKSRFLKFAAQYTQGAPIQYTGVGQLYSTVEMDSARYTRLIDTCVGDVFLFDEECESLYDNQFCDKLMASPNYFMIVSRERFSRLPYGADSIYVMEGGPNHYHMELMYPPVRWPCVPTRVVAGTVVICEDKGNGRICTETLLCKYGYNVYSAESKDKLYDEIHKWSKHTCMLIAADRCGLGAATHSLMAALSTYTSMYITDSRSFEWCALNSGIVGDYMPYDFTNKEALLADSEESYYTDLLHALLSRYYNMSYTKTQPNFCELICHGHVLQNKQIVSSRRRIISDSWLFPDFPRKVVPIVAIIPVDATHIVIGYEDGTFTTVNCKVLSLSLDDIINVQIKRNTAIFGSMTVPLSELNNLPPDPCS